ncbi:site-specific integrase [Streptomyces palmae]|uniref:site-specific integrase n=1 Tax=Streptomyces palmae TaxID=1701085 RepID=UPI001FD83366|nr:site-specific integrase [Streptomyces palmae]
MALAAVRDLREFRDSVSAEELEQFETDVLAGFVLARASAGLADGTIRGDVGHLDQMRSWFGRPLWDMEPTDADGYFGTVLRGSPSGTRLARAQALTTYFLFLELRHKVEIHRMTGRVVECPIDEMDRPRGSKDAALRIPPTEPEIKTLFTGWGGELATCRTFARTARNYTASKLMSQVGLSVSEACELDLADIKWDLGRFGKLHVRHGEGARGSGPRERMVPLINGADRTLRWFIEDVWGQFDDDPGGSRAWRERAGWCGLGPRPGRRPSCVRRHGGGRCCRRRGPRRSGRGRPGPDRRPRELRAEQSIR